MRTFNSNFSNHSALDNQNPITLCILKMDFGDVRISDIKVGIADGLANDYMPWIESFGQLNDGSTLDSFLFKGSLESFQMRFNLIYSDQTKSVIHSIINEGIFNKKIELYKWFIGIASQPELIDILYCQDPINLNEDSMSFSFDAVSVIMTENPKLYERQNDEEIFPAVIGKAQRVPLKYLKNNPTYTKLEENIDEYFVGIIKIEDGTKFNATGNFIINNEEVSYNKISATHCTITARALNGTIAQDHSSGSLIFPKNAIYKYALCAGPVGSIGNLLANGETYSGGNAVFHPELNPAQVWFSTRLPWLKKDQNFTISDDGKYGKSWDATPGIVTSWPSTINDKVTDAEIYIPYNYFTYPNTTETRYQYSSCKIPAIQGDGSTYADSGNIMYDKGFAINQTSGDNSYREIYINHNAQIMDQMWCMIAFDQPESDNGRSASQYQVGQQRLYIGFAECKAKHMNTKIEIFHVRETGLESSIFSSTNFQKLASSFVNMSMSGNDYDYLVIDLLPSDTKHRFKIVVTLLDKYDNTENNAAYFRFKQVINGVDYNYCAIRWKYNYYPKFPLVSPNPVFISSKFNRNLSRLGTFTSAKARISFKHFNFSSKATGNIKIYDGTTLKSTINLSDGTETNTTINLGAAGWTALDNSIVKIQVELTALDGDKTDFSAGIKFLEGIEWLISYTSNSLDSRKISYTSNLTADVTSTHGANWTPSNAIKYLIQDYTTYYSAIDSADFTARNSEFVAKNHFLNGTIDGNSKLHDALRAVLFQGGARLKYQAGKIKMISYITDMAAESGAPVLIISSNDYIIRKRSLEISSRDKICNRIVANYNYDQEEKEYKGKYTLEDGITISEDFVDYSFVSSQNAIEDMTDYIFNIKKNQLRIFTIECFSIALKVEKGDIITIPSFISGDASISIRVISVSIEHGQSKGKKIPKVTIKGHQIT